MKLNVVLVFVLLFAAAAGAQTDHARTVREWRNMHEWNLKSDDSWFSLAGIFWLKEGANTVGRGPKFDVQLTSSFKKQKFGTIYLKNGNAVLSVENGVEAFSSGEQISPLPLVSDVEQKQTVIRTGSQSFYLMKRGERFAIRLKDKNNPALLSFKGLKWFPIDERFRVTATFEPFPTPKILRIPNLLGDTYQMKSEGLLHFTLDGKKYTLQPVEENGRFFIIFRDLTSKKSTYSVGRFLYASKSPDNKIILDFNKAENPPCAYTEFATCPIPPPQNRLPFSLNAGEKRYK